MAPEPEFEIKYLVYGALRGAVEALLDHYVGKDKYYKLTPDLLVLATAWYLKRRYPWAQVFVNAALVGMGIELGEAAAKTQVASMLGTVTAAAAAPTAPIRGPVLQKPIVWAR